MKLDHRDGFGNQSIADVIFRLYQQFADPRASGHGSCVIRPLKHTEGKVLVFKSVSVISAIIGAIILGGIVYINYAPQITERREPQAPNVPAIPAKFRVVVDGLEAQDCDLTATANWSCHVLGNWKESGGFNWDTRRAFTLAFHPNDHTRMSITDEYGKTTTGLTWESLLQGVPVGKNRNHVLKVGG